jgi:hypothetical protein
MIVRLFGSSGLTKAYRSVLSAAGSPAMAGASRWLDARTPPTDVVAMSRAPATPTTLERVVTLISPPAGAVTDPFLSWVGSTGCSWGLVATTVLGCRR